MQVSCTERRRQRGSVSSGAIVSSSLARQTPQRLTIYPSPDVFLVSSQRVTRSRSANPSRSEYRRAGDSGREKDCGHG